MGTSSRVVVRVVNWLTSYRLSRVFAFELKDLAVIPARIEPEHQKVSLGMDRYSIMRIV
jgi:galactokinase/mevalonate kinase-like predicted kinase